MGQAIARIGHNARLEAALGKTIDVPANLPNNVIQNHNQWMKDAGQAGSGTVKMKRRDAWARVLRASIDVHRFEGRRAYTNQSMLVDFNIYYANRGLMIVDRERALTEKQALRYVYEAIGLLPWLGNDTEEGGSEMPYGAPLLPDHTQEFVS